jgi:hypothetical protein
VQVLDEDDERPLRGEEIEESAPGRERLLALARGRRAEADERREFVDQPVPLASVLGE